MRRITLLPVLVMALLFTLPGEAQTTKDSPAAAATRARLKIKISIEMKNEMLREVLKEISGNLQDIKKGSLSTYPDQGVSMNSRITVVVQNKTVEEILDSALKPLDLGYIIVSKPGDRYDGWLLLKKGNFRGDENAPDGKKKEEAKAKDKDMPEKKDTTKSDSASDDKEAKRLLNNAKNYISLNRNEKAKDLLKEILDKHPNSKSVDEAKKLLESLDK
ncbi:hypothetical protein KIH39_02155 [Telmatocola sphagniphila]|uniref:Tetratricopeptide repeat protein n=1 Tax=Telmatocola sphagniphila TaxID=1123043 RepID=A0A8E6B5X1_9BACT|nr:hypothetical protein [Telmatocola sphagniphila]QVL32745.1 hypothetical protein KIH39_02155 [Telmatocola sphagniphila]